MIYFAILVFVSIVILGILISKKKKEVCTFCLKKFSVTHKVHDQVYLCDTHFKHYQESNLIPFFSVRCTPKHQDGGVYMYEFLQKIQSQSCYGHIISEYDLQGSEITTIQTLFIDLNKVTFTNTL